MYNPRGKSVRRPGVGRCPKLKISNGLIWSGYVQRFDKPHDDGELLAQSPPFNEHMVCIWFLRDGR